MRSEEKKTLKHFVLFYFSSTFILLGIIFMLIFKIQEDMAYNLTLEKMKNFSFSLSSKIITSHMRQENLDFTTLTHPRYKFALYAKDGKKIFGEEIDKKSITSEDKSPLGHLGIWSIVTQYDGFEQERRLLLKKTLLGFLLAYALISLIGYYLIHLFMRPIKEARKRLDNFIKDTTHELNTPITAIMLCASQEALKNPKNITRLYLSAKRVSELYQDLTYLFLEKGNKNKKEVIDLKEVIEEQLPYFEILAAKKGIIIQTKLEKLSVILAKEDFKRLFSNLLSNAIKYNRRNGSICITLTQEILEVRDSGIGIQKEQLKNIFDRYHRATTQSGGFGIGLSIVEKISQENNIPIQIDSNQKGTTFTLKLTSLRQPSLHNDRSDINSDRSQKRL